VSKKTGIDRTKPLAISDTSHRFWPNRRTNTRTTRSAAPEAIRQSPMIAASAITTPILPAVVPNASATRPILLANGPGANRLTTVAAVINARKALTRSATIMPMTIAMPTIRMSRGPAAPVPPEACAARTVERSSPFKILPSMSQGVAATGPAPVAKPIA